MNMYFGDLMLIHFPHDVDGDYIEAMIKLDSVDQGFDLASKLGCSLK